MSHEQEASRIAHQMQADGFSEGEIEQALAVYERRLRLIRQDKGIDQILAVQQRAEREAWFDFLTKIFSGANHGIGVAESGGRKERWQGFVPGYLDLMVEWLQARSSEQR
jgi:hypothetical protein